MTITQIIVWKAAPDELRIDEVAKAKLAGVQGVAGIQSSYFGEQHAADLPEGVKKCVWVNVWDSYDSAANQLEHIGRLFEQERDVQILHADVKFGSDLEKSLALPTTEVAVIVPKPGESIKWAEEFQNLRTKFESQGHTTAWGPTFKDTNAQLALVGWDSREEHLKVVGGKSTDPEDVEIGKIIEVIFRLAEPAGMYHVNLRQYST
ncbi:hypothetical protein FIBSPDRAFT_940674 [Athelia psychrophila]|uniref:ABM domain-containing protein n=1 Tax=Athelia psychrophila TaxID=1759441 RepID=A0A167VIE7_9AGAM|nr:hypothetical protein FIBSPDRAFT_940674 [Fibularhizoctonia sp. CBS 109695]